MHNQIADLLTDMADTLRSGRVPNLQKCRRMEILLNLVRDNWRAGRPLFKDGRNLPDATYDFLRERVSAWRTYHGVGSA